MNYSVAVKTSCVSTIIVAGVAAQSGSIYVNQQKVNAALAKGGVVLSVPNVKVAGVHRDRAGVLETLDGTAILYVTDGAATLVAGSETRSVTKGDVVIVPAGMRQSFDGCAAGNQLLPGHGCCASGHSVFLSSTSIVGRSRPH